MENVKRMQREANSGRWNEPGIEKVTKKEKKRDNN